MYIVGILGNYFDVIVCVIKEKRGIKSRVILIVIVLLRWGKYGLRSLVYLSN